MSASSKKKLRKEQNAAAMTERQKQQKKEAQSVKAMTVTFAVVMILVIAIVIGFVVTPIIQGIYYRSKHSITVGDHKISAAELTYFYMDAISEHQNDVYNKYYNSFGSYWTIMLGFDTTKPLNAQMVTKEGTETWADYFINKAIDAAKDTYALYDDANAKGYKLSDTEQKNLDSYFDSLEIYAAYSGASNVDIYLRNNYGKGANEKSYREYYTVCTLASSYYSKYAEDLEYEVEDYRAFEKDKFDDYSVVTYSHFTMNMKLYLGEGTKDENGNTVWTDAEKEAARAKLKADMETLVEAGIVDKDGFDKALQALEIFKTKETESDKKDETTSESDKKDETTSESDKKDETTSESDKKDETTSESDKKDETTSESDKKDETTSGSNSSSSSSSTTTKKTTATEVKKAYFENITLHAGALEWLKKAERKPGEFKAFEVYTYATHEDPDHEHGDDCGCSRTVDGYTFVLFTERDDQITNLVNVRHILVSFEGGTKDSSGNTTYSDAEKKKVKEEAEAILKEWQDGKANEESFGELANKKSDDQGGKVTNGGLYEDVYPGQMVEEFEKWCFDKERKAGDTGIVETKYGYHVMYYSSTDEMTYRDVLIEADLRKSDAEKWHDDLVEKTFFEKVDLSLLEYDYVVEKH